MKLKIITIITLLILLLFNTNIYAVSEDIVNPSECDINNTLRTYIDGTALWYPVKMITIDVAFNINEIMTIPDDMNLTIYDPSGNLFFNISLNDTEQIEVGYYNYKYSLPNDFSEGQYQIDIISSKDGCKYDARDQLTLIKNKSSSNAGLEAKVSTKVVWYPNNIMMFDMLFSYAGNMTTPDDMTLTVYDPAARPVTSSVVGP